MTFNKFAVIIFSMKYVTEEFLEDIEDYLLEKYEYEYEQPLQHILFQTVDYSKITIENIVKTDVETFQDKLFQMIKDKNLDEVEIYKKGNISRQLFSKIRSEKDYHPAKNTVFSLAIGMELNIDEASELLEKAGFAFSSASKADLIIQYFMYHKNYNIFAINEVLEKYGLETL